MPLRPRILFLLFLALAVMASAPAAFARGGNYSFEGGTGAQRAQVENALAASSFDWSVVASQVTIHIGRNMDSHATPGDVWLDARLLDSGRFSWGVVQHEFAHQVDFLLLTQENRVELQRLLGAKAWCWDTSGFEHADYGCERFASTLASDGLTNEEIGKRLFLSPETVRTHVQKAMRRLEADTRTQAVALALRQSLIG